MRVRLVFLDLARPVVLIVAAHGQTVLGTAIHRLGINIIVLFAILHQPLVVAPLLEVLDRFLIHLFVMLVGNRIEVDFRLDDVEQRALGSLSLGLLRVQHVVRTRRNLGSQAPSEDGYLRTV